MCVGSNNVARVKVDGVLVDLLSKFAMGYNNTT